MLERLRVVVVLILLIVSASAAAGVWAIRTANKAPSGSRRFALWVAAALGFVPLAFLLLVMYYIFTLKHNPL